jgi:hypothetical protein
MYRPNPGISTTSPQPLSPLTHLRVFAGNLLSLAAIAVFASATLAQSTGGAKGKVRNLNDQGIADATVSARQKGVDIKSVKSDSKGNFEIGGLQSGIYNLAFEARGYSAAVQYNVEIKSGKIRDLGDRLILMVDRGSRVIVRGTVFFKDGFLAPGAKITIERVNADGSTKKLGETGTNAEGEFSFSQPEGSAQLRIKAAWKDGRGTKEIEVDSAQVYRLAVTLDTNRPEGN